MSTYADVVNAAGLLSLDEQEALLDLLQRRLADERRRLLNAEVQAAREENAQGKTKPTSVEQIMRGVSGDA